VDFFMSEERQSHARQAGQGACQMDAKCPQCGDKDGQVELGYAPRQQATVYYCRACRNLYYVEDEDNSRDDEGE
jgi:hypothetical protein